MSTFASTTASRSSQEKTERTIRVISDKNELQVFLGGSCNPTTWRQNLAIPYLEMNGISYYNPQIENWTPEVVALEHRAKQDAQILLFVIDDQTRATVTLIESAFMAGDDKNIVFVFYPFETNTNYAPEQPIEAYQSRQKLTKTGLIGARNKMSLVCTASAESSSLSMSSTTSISKANALDFRSTFLSSCTSRSSSNPSNLKAYDSDGLDLEKRRELTRLADCSLRLAGESISVEEFRELRQARSILKNLIDMRKIPTFPDIPQALNHISCHIRSTVARLKSESDSSFDVKSCPSDMRSCRYSNESNKYFTGSSTESQIRDVYLSIDSDDCTIMDTIVIPMLEASGLSYNYMSMKNIVDPHISIDESPLVDSRIAHIDKGTPLSNQEDREEAFNDKSLRLLYDQSVDRADLAIAKQLNAVRTSKVLLFVITNKCRGLSIMVLASYFMALLRNNIVLCVQYLEEPCTIGGEQLSKTAIADYNRGRVYLCDDALKSRVPVFSTIREAIECCSRKCQHIK